MIFEVIFDLETKKLFSDIEGTNPADLKVSIVSLYQRKLDNNLKEIEGAIKSFWEEDFSEMWEVFQSADRIIGYNSKKFDCLVLDPYANFPFTKLAHFDVFEVVRNSLGRRIGLDALAKETLGKEKAGIGTDAVKFWRKGDKESLEKLKKYCEMDVLITKEVYDFGLKEKHLKYSDKWNNQRLVEVDFSYPQKPEGKTQNTLF
jgi:DEAD/DEAH box helicase domain-containing protein